MVDGLKMCDGPPCTRCGCRDVLILQDPIPNSWFTTGRARCRHCGRSFSFREKPTVEPVDAVSEFGPVELPPVDFQFIDPFSTRIDIATEPQSVASTQVTDPAKCPDCGATAKAYTTKGRTQYRKCPACGKKYKTMRDAG
jgi:transcription elongation factor Elf1